MSLKLPMKAFSVMSSLSHALVCAPSAVPGRDHVGVLFPDENNPLWHMYFLRAQTEREDVLFSETRGWLKNRDITLFDAELEVRRHSPVAADVK